MNPDHHESKNFLAVRGIVTAHANVCVVVVMSTILDLRQRNPVLPGQAAEKTQKLAIQFACGQSTHIGYKNVFKQIHRGSVGSHSISVELPSIRTL